MTKSNMTALTSTLLVSVILGFTACGAPAADSETTSAQKNLRKDEKKKPSTARQTEKKKPKSVAQQDEKKKQSRIIAQQDALCSRVCKRLTQCTVQYAAENLTPAVAAEMATPATRAEQIKDCHNTRSECLHTTPTQKGANQTGQCLRENSACAPLIECLN